MSVADVHDLDGVSLHGAQDILDRHVGGDEIRELRVLQEEFQVSLA